MGRVRSGRDIVAQPPQNRQAAYDAAVAKLKADGGNVSGLEGAPWNVGVKLAVNHVQSVDDLIKGTQPQTYSLAAGSTRVTDDPLNPNGPQSVTAPDAPPKPTYENEYDTGRKDAQGNPIYAHGYVSPQGFTPVGGNPQSQGSPSGLTGAVVQQESGGNPNAVSSAGAQGLMQLMPQTAANPGFGIQPARDGSPQENMRVGQQYLSALMSKYSGNTKLALAAYNAGPGRVDGALSQAQGDPDRAISMLPAETQNYVPSVLARLGNQGSSQGDAGGIGTSMGMGGGAPSTASPQSNQLAPGEFTKPVAKAGVPSGYRLSADGQSLEAIPGGPADKGAAIAPLGDTTKTGYDYLQTLGDPSLQAQIQGIAEGRFPLPKVSRPSKQGEISPLQLQQAVAQYDPTYDQADPTSRIKARNDFTSGKSGVQLRQLNTLLGHLGGLSDAADKLNNGNYSTLNSIENTIGQATGSTKATNFNAAAGPAAEEFAALLKGGVPSVEEIKAAQSRLNSSMSPDQLHGSIGTMAAQVQSRIAALQAQAKNSLGPFANKVQIITPEGQAALDKLRTKGLIGKFDLGEEGTQPDAQAQPAQSGWSIQRVQ